MGNSAWFEELQSRQKLTPIADSDMPSLRSLMGLCEDNPVNIGGGWDEKQEVIELIEAEWKQANDDYYRHEDEDDESADTTWTHGYREGLIFALQRIRGEYFVDFCVEEELKSDG